MDNQRLFTLLGGTARRDPQAFTQLYQEFYPAVYGMALSVLKKPDASADAAQEVFLRLWTLPAQSFPTANPGAWLYTVTRRQALEIQKSQHAALPLEELPPLPDPAPGPESVLDWESFQQLVAPLDEISRQIVTLKLAAGCTHREIAALLCLRPATVRWKYAKAVHALGLFWADLLGALALGFLGLRALLPQTPTAGAPSEGGLVDFTLPAPPPWLPGALLSGLAALLAAGAVYWGCQLWNRSLRKKSRK